MLKAIRPTTLLSVLVLLGGLIVGGVGLTYKKGKQRPAAPQSALIRYIASQRNADGVLEPVGYYVCAVHSSGLWKESRYSFNGDRSELASDEQGLFMRRGGEAAKQLFSPADPRVPTGYRTAEEFTRSPQFLRTETFLGRTVYVLSTERNETDEDFSELTFAPEIGAGGNTPLRTIAFDRAGVMLRVDAIAIEVGDLSEADVRLPSDLPVKTDMLEHKVETLRKLGQGTRADSLQALVNQHRQK